jgi:lipopolysaccharide/colanic/teichoic acid biosynthesis glycosyltransferase
MLTVSQQRMKRTFDVLAATAGVVLLSPLLAVIAIIVYFDSPGGIFYRATRTGIRNRPFLIIKFRTMIPAADEIGGGSTAKDDPRVTRVGRILRKHKLDEWPQLFNVLRGEMSIIGPRPELPKYTQLYQGDERLILSVRPGITDYASLELFELSEILGRDDADRVYEERVRPAKNAMRLKYVQEQTLVGDLQILLRTLQRVFWR